MTGGNGKFGLEEQLHNEQVLRKVAQESERKALCELAQAEARVEELARLGLELASLAGAQSFKLPPRADEIVTEFRKG